MSIQRPGVGRLIGGFLIALLLTIHYNALADSEMRPSDFKKVTENRKYVFVMLVPDSNGREDSKLRKQYAQSGLYKNDGSNIPLWTVDWYAFNNFASADGEHLIRMGPWASSTKQLAIAFYKKGRELKRYQIQDLISNNSNLFHTTSHFFWELGIRVNDRKGEVTVTTADKVDFKFNMKTGEIVSRMPVDLAQQSGPKSGEVELGFFGRRHKK